MELTVPGEPKPKGRPRFTKNGGVYTDKSTQIHERLLRDYLRLHCKEPLQGGVGLGVTFFRGTRRRVDIDNLVKTVLDAAQGIAFADDVQIVELAARKELDRQNPRTVILIEPRGTSMLEA